MFEKKKKYFWFYFLLLLCGLRPAFGFFPFKTDSAQSLDYSILIPRIQKACSIIERHYYDPDRIHPEKALKQGLNFLSIKIPEMRVEFPQDPGHFTVSIGNQSRVMNIEKPEELSDILQPLAE